MVGSNVNQNYVIDFLQHYQPIRRSIWLKNEQHYIAIQAKQPMHFYFQTSLAVLDFRYNIRKFWLTVASYFSPYRRIAVWHFGVKVPLTQDWYLQIRSKDNCDSGHLFNFNDISVRYQALDDCKKSQHRSIVRPLNLTQSMYRTIYIKISSRNTSNILIFEIFY